MSQWRRVGTLALVSFALAAAASRCDPAAPIAPAPVHGQAPARQAEPASAPPKSTPQGIVQCCTLWLENTTTTTTRGTT